MPKKVDIPALTSVTLTPHPGGYFLDAWLDGADPAAGGENMQRFKFDSTQQMVDFSKEVRRTALLSVGFEELLIAAGEVQEGYLLAMMNLAVDSIDLEKKYAEIVAVAAGARRRPGRCGRSGSSQQTAQRKRAGLRV